MTGTQVLPSNVQTWLSTLVFEAKRDYATRYATNKVQGKKAPKDPKTGWAEKARARVDELLADPKKVSGGSKSTRNSDIPDSIKLAAKLAFDSAFAAAPDGARMRAGKTAYGEVLRSFQSELETV